MGHGLLKRKVIIIKGKLTKEEKEYLRRTVKLFIKFKETMHKIVSLHKSEMTEKNFTEYIKKNGELKNELDSFFNEKIKLDNEFAIYLLKGGKLLCLTSLKLGK